jgi:hypothetical protein
MTTPVLLQSRVDALVMGYQSGVGTARGYFVHWTLCQLMEALTRRTRLIFLNPRRSCTRAWMS